MRKSRFTESQIVAILKQGEAGGVLPASALAVRAGRRRGDGAERCGRPAHALGLLEVLPSAAARRPRLESQAGPPRVLRAAPEPTAADEAAGPGAAPTAARRSGRLNETWALDFMTDALYDGRRFRTFNVLDEGNREALAIEIGPSIPSARVIRVLDDLMRFYGRPARVRVDNGPELTAEAFVEWCTAHRIAIDYIQPGKPDQKAFIERFNRSYREEVLDAHLFDTLDQVREITEAWLEIYNTERPHDGLGQVPPLTFLPRPDVPVESSFAVST